MEPRINGRDVAAEASPLAESSELRERWYRIVRLPGETYRLEHVVTGVNPKTGRRFLMAEGHGSGRPQSDEPNVWGVTKGHYIQASEDQWSKWGLV